MFRAFRYFSDGFNDMMQLTCFRGPWAYDCMAEQEGREPSNAYEWGRRVACLFVLADEARKERARG